MRACTSSTESKTTARPRCRSRCGDAAAGLMIAPAGARLPYRTAIPAFGWNGVAAAADHVPVPDLRVTEGLDQRPARDGDGIGVEQVGYLAQHGQQSAGPVQVLHQVLAGRLQVHQQRHAGSRSGRSRRGSAAPRAARRWPAGARRRSSTRRSRRARRSHCGTTPWSGSGSACGRRRPSRRSACRSRGRGQQAAVRGRESRRCPAGPCRAPRRAGPWSRRCPWCCSAHGCGSLTTRTRRNASSAQRSRPDLLAETPDAGAAAERVAAEGAGQHRAARHDDGRAGPPRRPP